MMMMMMMMIMAMMMVIIVVMMELASAVGQLQVRPFQPPTPKAQFN